MNAILESIDFEEDEHTKELAITKYVHRCLRCWYRWESRYKNPLKCAECQNYRWNKPRIGV